MDYSEHIVMLNEYQKDLSDALRHNRLDEVPALTKEMRLRLDRIEEYVQTHA